MYSVRPARRMDLPLLVDLHQQCFPADDLADFERGHWWVLWCGNEAAGFAGLYVNDDHVYLCRSGVLPKHQGRGLQKRLIRVRLRKARAIGKPWVLSDTSENPQSANSLISCGFRMFDPATPWGLPTSVYWRLALKQ